MGSVRRQQQSRVNPKKVRAAARQRQAMELRKAGLSYGAIAAELGYAHARAAQKAVETCLHDYYREPAEDLLKLELERLDRMQAGIYGDAISGDLGAVQMMLRIMERRARYTGLDAPTKQNLSIDQRQQVNVTGAVMVLRSDGSGGAVAYRVDGPKDDYIAGLQAIRGEAPLAIEGTSTVKEPWPELDVSQGSDGQDQDDA